MPANTRRYSVIRDPVHGDLYLTGEEMRVLDTREMQRLRGVRQLGTAYLVYPGAQHTRFEHSLGTLHVLHRIIDVINLNRSLAPRQLLGVTDEERRILRIAALVHDITHIPFGHNIEDQSGLLERHDSAARFQAMLSLETEVGQVLDDLGIRTEVLATLLPAETDRGNNEDQSESLPKVPVYWRELLSDTICADILDYLRRDAYFTGLNLFYDDRVMNYFKIDRDSGHLFVDVVKRGVVREDILSELIRVLEARYFFSERVYYHHAKIAAGAMVAQTVENALVLGAVSPAELCQQTDESLWLLLDQVPLGDAPVRRRQTLLLKRFRSRQLLKRACVFPRYANLEVQDQLVKKYFAKGQHQVRADFEAEVEEELRRRHAEAPLITLYCPAHHMQLKEAHTHIRFPGSDSVQPMSARTASIPRLKELEESYRNLWKLYVLASTDDKSLLDEIAEIVGALLPGATNAYTATE